jgi:hypothetical protein
VHSQMGTRARPAQREDSEMSSSQKKLHDFISADAEAQKITVSATGHRSR